MPAPWFDQNYAWIAGTLLGVTAGLFGGLAGWLAPRGRARKLVLGASVALSMLSLGMLVLGIVALSSGQPRYIWYGLLLPGAIGVSTVGTAAFMVRRAYRQAEQRRLAASDLF